MEHLLELSTEKEEEVVKDMESRLKKARVSVSELLHDALLAKAARTREKQWHGLNGREKLLFLDAWQENVAATATPPAEAKVIWRTLKKQGLQDCVMQSLFVFVSGTSSRYEDIRLHCSSWIC